MNIPTAIILFIIVCCFIMAVRKVIKDKKNGCGCSGCGGCKNCTRLCEK